MHHKNKTTCKPPKKPFTNSSIPIGATLSQAMNQEAIKNQTPLSKHQLKTPITYYGGKQRMARRICNLIPKHILYCEPYCGGCAVFFHKEPSTIEVLNDINAHVINFFTVLKKDFGMLKVIIDCTPYSRQQLQTAKHVLKYHEHYDTIKKARAFWVLCNMSFSGMLSGGYKYTRHSNKNTKAFTNKKLRFDSSLAKRLDNVDFECNEALKVIQSRDHKEAFFFIDPPYIADSPVNQGHYAGFTPENYICLLDTLGKLKGKFLLSNYPSEILNSYIKVHNRHVIEIP